MAFTNTWDASFEAVPTDAEDINLGASRIRALKVAVRERMQIDHVWEDAEEDGKHNKVTLTPQGSVPALSGLDGHLYTQTINSATELFYRDQAGNIIQFTQEGLLYPFAVSDFSVAADLAVGGNATIGEALSLGTSHVSGFLAFADPGTGDTYFQFATNTYLVYIQASHQLAVVVNGVTVQLWG